MEVVRARRAAAARFAAIVLACALLLVACSSSASEERSGTGSPTSAPAAGTAPATGADDGAPADRSAPSGGPDEGPSAGTSATTESSTPAPGAATSYPGDPGPVPVGRLAPFLLRPATGTRLVLEVSAQPGAAPRAGTLDHLAGALRDASRKEVVVDGVAALGGGGQEWTAATIAAAADRAARHEQGGGQGVVRLLYLRGSFEGDAGVLGVAVRGDVAAIFSDQVTAAAGVVVDPAVVEDAVSMHELGHLLGLVDLIVGSGRGDPEHPGHSRSRDSVMYWQVESGLVGQLLGGGIPRQFDAADRAELATIRTS